MVEGIDGSGKSTQLRLLEQWLRYNEFEVFRTEWNSSDMVRSITSKGKKKEILVPTTFSLLHATDLQTGLRGTYCHCCMPDISYLQTDTSTPHMPGMPHVDVIPTG